MSDPPPLKLILRAARVGPGGRVSVVFLVVSSSARASPFLRAIELIEVIVVGVLALAAVVALVTGWLAGWQQDEAEFELVVRRAERLAHENLAVDPDELEFMELDPLHDGDFEELVRDALDELPDLLQNASTTSPS
jgi:hypothetical protein